MKYKVGQRVWIKELKCFGKIDKIEKPMLFDNYYINGNEYTQAELHQIADDMFKALGYEVKKLKDYIIYQRKNGITTYSIPFSLKDKEYACTFSNIGDYGNRLFIPINLHQAIHQKMIELGWLE